MNSDYIFFFFLTRSKWADSSVYKAENRKNKNKKTGNYEILHNYRKERGIQTVMAILLKSDQEQNSGIWWVLHKTYFTLDGHTLTDSMCIE